MRHYFLATLLLLLAALPAQAAHITDKLVVGLYAKQSLEGEPIQLLTSGTPIEVLERKSEVAKVRLADDRKGWVEAGYLTEEKPASMMLLEAQAQLRQLKAQQGAGSPTPAEAALQEELGAARERISYLEKAQTELLAARIAQSRLEELRERVQKAVDLLGVDRAAKPPEEQAGSLAHYLPWILGLGMLIVGFLGGAALVDYRVRKKFGGVRI